MIDRYYRSYEDDDRQAIEALLHQSFTFTSPNDPDDRIDRATYFERCWPNHERITSFSLLDVCADSEQAMVRYRGDVRGEAGFQCVDHWEFRDDLVSHIECYFGRDPKEATSGGAGAREKR